MKINQNKVLIIVLFLGIINVIFSEEPNSVNVGTFKEELKETNNLPLTGSAITTEMIVTSESSIEITTNSAIAITTESSIVVEVKEEKSAKYLLENYTEVEGTVQKGQATYYAKKFHGNKTSSGEKFSIYKYTGAHKTLKFGTLVKVTNIDNGKSVIVKINDRGPFGKGKVIDISPAAFEELASLKKGVLNVKIEVVKEKTKKLVEEGKTIENQIKTEENNLKVIETNKELTPETDKPKKEDLIINEGKSGI